MEPLRAQRNKYPRECIHLLLQLPFPLLQHIKVQQSGALCTAQPLVAQRSERYQKYLIGNAIPTYVLYTYSHSPRTHFEGIFRLGTLLFVCFLILLLLLSNAPFTRTQCSLRRSPVPLFLSLIPLPFAALSPLLCNVVQLMWRSKTQQQQQEQPTL